MIYFGFDEVVYGWPRYFDLCNAFEVRRAARVEEDPSLETLNRWRVDSPRGFAWLLHTQPALGELVVDAFERGAATLPGRVDELIAADEARAHALAAKALVLETPPDLQPSDTSRALLAELGERIRAQSKRVVLWESSGLWTAEDATAVAKAGHMTHVVDPFLLESDGEPPRPTPLAAWRVTERAGARRQFDSWEMEQLVDWASGNERTFVLLAGRFKIPHAKELSLLLRED